MKSKVRIGIDVGGTFTDAVIIDNATGEILAIKKIPTTHSDDKGVAFGITQIVSELLEELKLDVKDVVFIAHGTTQATNALLEGDVAKVGIIGIGSSKTANKEMNVSNIELADNKYLEMEYEYIDIATISDEIIEEAINALDSRGVEVFVITQEYAIDNPEHEIRANEVCERLGKSSTMAHTISELYGLKVRTRTAVVNASLIPKMLETAEMTETVVKNLGIPSELMIMRADGGVMSISEMKHRPILTMLSGLAAGVAGALIYEKVTDGIFLEAGGTSTDISLIKSGEVIINNAIVGKHKTYMKALDVRTLAIAGGSMIRLKNSSIADVGPRSAHLAGVEYECFANEDFTNYNVKMVSPCNGDPDDYALISNGDKSYSYTLAGAVNFLGYVPEGDYAYGNKKANEHAWEVLGDHLGKSAKEVAQSVVDIAMAKVDKIVQQLITEYEVDKTFLELIGGGGSASIITYALGEKNGIKAKVAKNAPYISTIGVGLAILREQIERSVMNPTNDDIKKIRQDVMNKIIKSGAKKETIKIDVKIDTQKNIVIATATAASNLNEGAVETGVSIKDIKKKIALGYDVSSNNVSNISNTKFFSAFEVEVVKPKLFGLLKQKQRINVVANGNNVIKLKSKSSSVYTYEVEEFFNKLDGIIEENSSYSDAGQTVPNMYIFTDANDYNYSGLTTSSQIKEMIKMDFEYLEKTGKLIAVAETK
ncbi:MAG: hydantoinase/oxoprolinase family protein [Erysipelotrichaceae bacterium]